MTRYRRQSVDAGMLRLLRRLSILRCRTTRNLQQNNAGTWSLATMDIIKSYVKP